MENRAYSLLTEKAWREDDDFFYVEGIASTPTPDKMDDIVEPMGARFKTPMPLLLYHDHKLPVGSLTFAKPEAKGVPFKGRLPKVKEAGTVQDRVNEAIHSVKYDLITAVSIGFSAIEGKVERLKSGGLRFLEWNWHELSLVVVPANGQAVLQAIKSIDNEQLTQQRDKLLSIAPPPASVGAKTSATSRGAVKLIPRRK